jgi:preprotein translocase subunit SecG
MRNFLLLVVATLVLTAVVVTALLTPGNGTQTTAKAGGAKAEQAVVADAKAKE